MTIVVTGATGHLGGALVRGLLAAGRQVRALVHHSHRGLEGLDVELVEGDLTAPDSLSRAFKGAETVYHAAARVSLAGNDWPLLYEVNVRGTRNVIDACRARDVRRLVHFSSIEALAPPRGGGPVDESCPLIAVGPARGRGWLPPYARSKAGGEMEVRRAIAEGLDAVILHPTGILGPYDFRPSPFGQALLTLAQGRLPIVVEGGFDWVDSRDVVTGALQAERAASPGSRYLLSGHWVAIADLAEQAAAFTGARAPFWAVPIGVARAGAPFAAALARLTGRPPVFTRASLTPLSTGIAVSHALATKELGYQPRPFEETLRDTLAWFAAAGRLARR